MKKLYFWILRHIPRPVLIVLSYVFSRFSSVLYMGNNVECPVCGGKFRKMLPYGVWEVRENALCPKCLSLERHRMMWLFLQNKTDLFKTPKKVLHVAPEQCFKGRFKKYKNLEYVTADLVSPIADVKMDVQDMPFADAEFDVVFCNHVLEHVPDDNKALTEIYRVLKPGGFAILFVPIDFKLEHTYEDLSITDPMEREKHFHQKDHLRLYGKDYPELVKKTGFVIDAPNYIDELDEATKNRFCIDIMEYMYAYKKSVETTLNG
jgi:SAM-dependent methyltransferase